MNYLDNILENVPRKDVYYKDKIRYVSDELLKNIFMSSYVINTHELDEYTVVIKSDIALIDFMLERLHNKRYINEKNLYKIGLMLIEINKMVTGWLNNKYDSENK